MRKRQKNKVKKLLFAKVVNDLGGVVAVSNMLGVSHSGISRWIYTDKQIPIKHAIKIEKITKGKVKAKQLRPDIFD